MKLDETTISRAIIERFTEKLKDALSLDVAIVGGGPAGLMAAYLLAKKKKKVALFERKLSIGGGMWGGGMMFNEIVVQEEGKRLLDQLSIGSHKYQKGYYTADAVETVSTLCSQASKAGARMTSKENLASLSTMLIPPPAGRTSAVPSAGRPCRRI